MDQSDDDNRMNGGKKSHTLLNSIRMVIAGVSTAEQKLLTIFALIFASCYIISKNLNRYLYVSGSSQ